MSLMRVSLDWTVRSSSLLIRGRLGSHLKPSERALDDPGLGHTGESSYARSAFDHVQILVSRRLAPVGELLAAVGGVGPDRREARGTT
jgi:hypothetical protein